LFSLANPNGAKALKQKTIGTVPQRIRKDGIIKDVINTFDQITLLNEVEKLINDEKRLQTETKKF
jgi:chemotaxis signal transduction protein